MKTTYLKPWFALVCFTMIICSASCSSSDDSESQVEQEQQVDATLSTQVLNALNDHRSSIEKSALITNDYATTLANKHSLYMAAEGKLSYDNLEERASLLIKAENPSKIAESVASKYKTADEVLEAMLNHSGNKNNIEADFTHIGIGANKSDAGVYYYSFIFLKK
ncbi:CAP domain-containing protein [Tamlana sp. 2_MG-2023]|uniref:CAP domain-containing protein n=1 Tax=unclassified Tamlana TaxID=2614803 RepID=UPI0026E3D85F|nr:MULTISPECIES: CAP domain-containing protein [unclassified Tamlana]MDO6761103.1 CAP domain-containing protein [Tamlana sp. 2_MG-2023]MDO6791564.1 CAP domain-containing protein [Tamlana sp. 1_MG-2023]